MFVDNEMAAFLNEEPLRTVASRFGTRVFSLSTKGRFLEYLDELESKVDRALWNVVEDLYPSGWLDAPTELITAARSRRDRQHREANPGKRPGR